MRLSTSAALLALVLPACGGEPEESGNIPANEVASRLAALRMEPGLWETRSAVVGVSAPDLPLRGPASG